MFSLWDMNSSVGEVGGHFLKDMNEVNGWIGCGEQVMKVEVRNIHYKPT